MHGFGPVFWATASRQPGQVSVWSSSQVVLSVVLLLVLVLSAMAQEDGQKVSVRVARVGAVNGRAEQLNGVERRMKVELFSVRPDAELQYSLTPTIPQLYYTRHFTRRFSTPIVG